jgi:hypothetical protein
LKIEPPDPELARLLSEVNDLAETSSREAALDPDAAWQRISSLRERFVAVRANIPEVELIARLNDYAGHRFELVDDASEYAAAGQELLTLSQVLSDTPLLVAPALQQTLVRLSSLLGEPEVPKLFGRLLRRLRELGRQSGDPELKAWVEGVISVLPSE